MARSRWIWYRGDFEIYHGLLLHNRREEFGCVIPTLWTQYTPYPIVSFKKHFTAEKNGSFRIISNGSGNVRFDGAVYKMGAEISFDPGEHDITVLVGKPEGLPCIFSDSDDVITDSSWLVSNNTASYINAGDTPAYYDAEDSPQVFRFAYETVGCVYRELRGDGILFDFGRELFASLCIENCIETQSFTVYYGESAEEAVDTSFAYLYEKQEGKQSYRLRPRAFRYVYIPLRIASSFNVFAEYEYLELEYKGSFECEDELINRVWQTCAYTFHLNSREFFLDGIKRDRWVWSGDAFQSYMINDFLFHDDELTKRTITLLRGKDPVVQHINTINDYSLYLIIGTYNYYMSSGDEDFIRFIYPRMRSLCDFIISRLDENGFVVHREGDWIFIDWADYDREGAVCAEQMLLCRAMQSMGCLARLCGEDGEYYDKAAAELADKINSLFWREEKGAYIDSFASGRENVTRHANIFAIMFDIASPQRQEIIVSRVLENEEITQITTPYFKFFELDAMCKAGRPDYATQLIRSYWGGMIKLGATSIWEMYNPDDEGAAHYGMYGMKYGKSLCHAWGAGPVYLLGRYYLGVYPTSAAAATFNVEPHTGSLRRIMGTVPLCGGYVYVEYNDGHLRVYTDKDGGTLCLGDKKYALEKDVYFECDCILQ